MKMYGKIVCGALRVPLNYPSYIELDGMKVYNPTEEQLLAAGYLPIEEKEPEEKAGKVAVPAYKVSKDGTKIVQSWSYVKAPEPMHDQETVEPVIDEQ